MHLVATGAGEIEGDAGDALDLVGGIDLGVDGALLAVLERHDLLGLAEIDAARQLAQDQDVEPFDDLALQGRSLGKCGIADRRAQVGEQVEILADAQQSRLRADLVGHLVPLGAADGAEQDGGGGVRLPHGLLGDGHAVLVDCRPAREVRLRLEPGRVARLVEQGDQPLDLGHDLDADAVAGQEQETMSGRHRGGSPDRLAWQGRASVSELRAVPQGPEAETPPACIVLDHIGD